MIENLTTKIESILFITARPLTKKKLAEIVGRSTDDVAQALSKLQERYHTEPERGIQLNVLGQSFQLSTAPASAGVVQRFLEEEEKKELTKPSLEALTIIAYRGPITKEELELIRGVNCSMILRNLLIRGLIDTENDALTKMTKYVVTFDFLQYLGIREPRELPDYERLNNDEHLQRLLSNERTPSTESAGVVATDASDQKQTSTEKEVSEEIDSENDDDDEEGDT